MAAIVGRGAELEYVEALFDDAKSRMRALVIDGEPGIGKTTIWRAGVVTARERGLTVLAAQPAQSESTLPYAALGDILAPLLDGHLERLPDVQRTALEIALQRRSVTEPAEELAVGRATLELIGTADSAFIAIDDIQWLDSPSAHALEFALRRLEGSCVRVLIARRSEHSLPAPLGLDRTLDDERLDARRLGPLGLGELGDLVLAHIGIRLLRPKLEELRQASGGNPFYALEIARGTAHEGDFHVPASLAAALEVRLGRLSAGGRDAALLSAAAARPTAALVERAAESTDGLAEAVSADILTYERERLRFTHPLLASVAYESAAPWERREAHRRLARVATGDERARNLALSTDEPDPIAAAEVAEAAELASARAAFATAAFLAERAARMTPDDEAAARVERLASAATFHRDAGDYEQSQAILEALIDELEPGPRRADLLRVLAGVCFDTPRAITLCRQAIDEAVDDPLVQSQAHVALAAYLWIAGDPEQSLEHSARSVDTAARAGDDAAVATSTGQHCYIQVLRGERWDVEAMERALEAEARLDALPEMYRPSTQLGLIYTYTDDLARARELLDASLTRFRAAGRVTDRWAVHLRRTQLGLKEGRWRGALEDATAARELAAQTGGESEVAIAETVLALVFAHLGSLDVAEAHAQSGREHAERVDQRHALITVGGALGFIRLSRGAYADALEHLTPARRTLEAFGIREFSPYAVVENEIDALIASGDLAAAEALIDAVEAAGQRAERVWHRAIASRGQALVASMRDQPDVARVSLGDALAAHERLGSPFELGRTLLAQGQIERRFRARGAARAALTRALEIFDELGAAVWAEKAATELARIPGRSRASSELTETERRVAELVAEGLSNKAVAARLFITVRTVEANLTKVYAKLGIRSRTELANKLHT